MDFFKLLQIHRKEKKKLFFCLCYALAIGIVQCLVMVIPLSLFLDNYSADLLPFIYVGIALATLLTGFLFTFFERKLSFFFFFFCLLATLLSLY